MNRRVFLQTLGAAASTALTPAPPERIDTHTHCHRPVPDLIKAFNHDNWRALSICVSRAVGDDVSILDEMIRSTIELHRASQAPSKEEILAACDCVLEKHPKLRVIGCHLGSNEEHWDRLAQRLDSYPNFAVDVAARVRYFVNGDHAQDREFLLNYQDRVLYGTDFTLAPAMSGAQAAEQLGRTHDLDWNFLATTNTLTYRRVQTTGLGLPATVVRKIFRENAIRWLPGIASR